MSLERVVGTVAKRRAITALCRVRSTNSLQFPTVRHEPLEIADVGFPHGKRT